MGYGNSWLTSDCFITTLFSRENRIPELILSERERGGTLSILRDL